MPRKNPLPEKEQEICKRLRNYRERIKFSQIGFAREAGIDSSNLAACEHLRSPLRYQMAQRLCSAFHIGPRWLATGKGSIISMIDLPDMSQIEGATSSTLFSEFFELALGKEITESEKSYEKYGSISVNPDAVGRVFIEEYLSREIRTWIESVPDSKLNEFVNKLIHFGARQMETYPVPNQKSLDKVVREMETVRAKLTIRRRILQKEN